MAALTCAKDPKYHDKRNNIEVKYRFIGDMVAQKEVVLKHISMSQMIANPLTKPINVESFRAPVRTIGFRRW